MPAAHAVVTAGADVEVDHEDAVALDEPFGQRKVDQRRLVEVFTGPAHFLDSLHRGVP